MAKPFEGKVVFITGAASGIGRATAIYLSGLGALLALSDVNEDGLGNTILHCQSQIHYYARLDVSNEVECKKVLDDVVRCYGSIDHVFNCAGINPTACPLTEAPPDYFDKLFDVNIRGVYNVSRAAIPHLKPHSGCSFVNVSSILGVKPAKEMAIYCATKFAVVGFSKAMAFELGAKGIRVNVVTPGYIDTPTNASVVKGKEAMEESGKGVAMGRMGTGEEVAEVVAFLMSDGARYMNGSVVSVDGGR